METDVIIHSSEMNIDHIKMDVQKIIVVSLVVRSCIGIPQNIATCHDDFSLNPPDGVLKRNTFTWLAFVQYSHVTTGFPHYSKAPRVTLIHMQFVIGTAMDLQHLPKNYKLGNVIFGEYERDEVECRLTKKQLKLGAKCPRAYLEVPAVDIIPHPEFSRFGVSNSLALVKLLRPLKSLYMVPICMPSLQERTRKRKNKFVLLIDYLTNVPYNFDTETMGKKTLKLYTHKECRTHRMKSKLTSAGLTQVLCSSGCGVRTGAPIISHNPEGAFELIGIAAGGASCKKRSMRRRLIKDPPLYVDVYPYTTWIINVINANELPLPYPHQLKVIDSGTGMAAHKEFLRKRQPQKQGWRGRTFLMGNFCFKSPKKQRRRGSFFYVEKFEVNADPPAQLNISMQISAGIDCTVVCARLQLPSRLTVPTIDGVGGYNISVNFVTDWFPYTFHYSLALTGRNSTQKDMEEWISDRNK